MNPANWNRMWLLLYSEGGCGRDLRLLEAVKGCDIELGETHPHTIESLNNLIDLYEAWNKPEKAEEWRTKLVQKEDSEK